MAQNEDKWEKWYRMLHAAKRESVEWYDIAAMMENHHVRCGIVNRKPYDAKHLLEVAETALDAARQTLGESHPRTAEALQNLGFYYKAIKGDGDKATDFFQKAAALAGEHNPVLAETYFRLGIYLYQKRDVVAAQEVLSEALAIRREDSGGDSNDLAETLFILSYATAVTAGPDSAIELAKEALDILKAKSSESPLVRQIKDQLKELRRAQEA